MGNCNQGLSDEWQLAWATSEGRSILVYTIPHDIDRDAEWKSFWAAARRDYHGAAPNRSAKDLAE